ncbi:MAG TPA: hypothetical protein VFV41_15495 [Streptosporangiaceae bacterium]|nr:hypothetical protein [Streptosporangiaceae bacterium]
MGSRSRARARAKASEEAAGPGQIRARAGDASPAALAGTAAASPAGQHRPLTLTAAVIIEALEACLVLAAAIWAGVDTGAGQSYQLSSGIAITVIGVATAAGLVTVAAGLRQGRRWTRTPALLTQLFTGVVGSYLLQGGRYAWGIPAVLLGVTGVVVLLSPPSTKVLTAGMPQPGDRHRRP